nr:chemotaxis response regulator protein-glutamate methylesterase [Methyloferula stellata]
MHAIDAWPKPIRVVVVDDSALMRKIISRRLSEDRDIEVVGHAANAAEARAAIKSLDPDVVTLDVEMPDMNGLEFLEKLMRLRPTPVVMISSLTYHGAAMAIRALELGAIDCIAKPTSRDADAFSELTKKIKIAAMSRLQPSDAYPKRIVKAPSGSRYKFTDSIIAIGSSTGGVEALLTILSEFPENCPPTVITQHMPAGFTKSFADRLNKLCSPRVSEATEGALLRPGQIYLAPGGETHLEVVGSDRLRCQLSHTDAVNGHHPSVDVLFHSVAKSAGRKSIGVILTGMGRDGAAGLLSIRHMGGSTIGQDEKTCIIYGMPKVAAEMGAVEKQVGLDAIAAEILASSTSVGHVGLSENCTVL